MIKNIKKVLYQLIFYLKKKFEKIHTCVCVCVNQLIEAKSIEKDW